MNEVGKHIYNYNCHYPQILTKLSHIVRYGKNPNNVETIDPGFKV